MTKLMMTMKMKPRSPDFSRLRFTVCLRCSHNARQRALFDRLKLIGALGKEKVQISASFLPIILCSLSNTSGAVASLTFTDKVKPSSSGRGRKPFFVSWSPPPPPTHSHSVSPSLLQDSVMNACHRGCRLYSICQFVNGNAGFNTSKEECQGGESTHGRKRCRPRNPQIRSPGDPGSPGGPGSPLEA